MTISYRCLSVLWVLVPLLTMAQAPPNQPADYFNQPVADSDPLRTEQARELEVYIKTLASDRTRFYELFTPDYSSAAAFEKSAVALREAFCTSIGYPPPGKRPQKEGHQALVG